MAGFVPPFPFKRTFYTYIFTAAHDALYSYVFYAEFYFHIKVGEW